ncbi:MAG: hypothetical protein V4764_06260 [Burkholderia sp.]
MLETNQCKWLSDFIRFDYALSGHFAARERSGLDAGPAALPSAGPERCSRLTGCPKIAVAMQKSAFANV